MTNMAAFLVCYLAILLVFVTRHQELVLPRLQPLHRYAWWLMLASVYPFSLLHGWEVGIAVWLCVAMTCGLLLALLAPVRPRWLQRQFPLALVALVVVEQLLQVEL